jgi:hypothetical protein
MVGRAMESSVLSTISTKKARQSAARGMAAERSEVCVRGGAVSIVVVLMADLFSSNAVRVSDDVR